MFFNAHTYYSIKRNSDVAEPMRIVGALLADSALTGVISWTDLHNKTAIKDFAESLGKDEAPLGNGLMDHYELDLRSHDTFQNDAGYAFSHQTQRLRELVAQACGFDTPEQARGIAHNFIEAGVDVNLLRSDGHVQGLVRESLSAVDIELISKYVADFFKANPADTRTKLTAYIDLLVKYDLRDLDEWVKLWVEIISLLLKKKADDHAIREVLQLAVELTAKDYQKVIAPYYR